MHEQAGRASRRDDRREPDPRVVLARPESRPSVVAPTTQRTDLAGRERLAASIQRSAGNRAMAGLVNVQRWAVPAPADADCEQLIASINANTPHAPEWAKTRANFTYSYDYAVSGSTARVINGQVNHTAPVDMPEWSSSDPAMQTAWSAARGTLRAHERRHEDKATNWEGTLRSRLNELTVTFSNPGEISGQVTNAWNGWLADHQADQSSIDPFSVTIDCPTPAPESVEGTAEAEAAEATEPARE